MMRKKKKEENSLAKVAFGTPENFPNLERKKEREKVSVVMMKVVLLGFDLLGKLMSR